MIQMISLINLHLRRRKPIISGSMNKALVAVMGLSICSMFASDTNVISYVTTDKLDIINTDMKQRYNLSIKQDHSLLLTGYTIQDPISKLIKTYSVLHLDF
jgi:hypothetical protein